LSNTPERELPPTARARQLARAGRLDEAAAIVAKLLQERFGLDAQNVVINVDIYSLNSLNGFFEAGGRELYFKFHQEENEAEMAGEYYRAGLLAEAGLPVDQPLHVSTEPGQQILVYRRRHDRRFAEVVRDLDFSSDKAAMQPALVAERQLNEALIQVYRRTLHPIDAAQSAAEPVHRLFHERLVDASHPSKPGGRFAGFYRGQSFEFPGAMLNWDELSRVRFSFNGTLYRDTLGDLFAAAFRELAPASFAGGGGVTAHGDAHNANVWFEDGKRLVMFDPAFAGNHIPALLAEVKTTFHNIFAHPLWLYDSPAAAAKFTASAQLRDGVLRVETDWRPSQVRLELLVLKRDIVWRPLLAELKTRNLLLVNWRRIIRLALFLCPTLVMNLRAGATTHNPVSSLIGLAVAIMVGSEPVSDEDEVSRFLDAIDPTR
jgi:hypothetical protein